MSERVRVVSVLSVQMFLLSSMSGSCTFEGGCGSEGRGLSSLCIATFNAGRASPEQCESILQHFRALQGLQGCLCPQEIGTWRRGRYGATSLLAGDGSRMAYLLCAQVRGDTWLCHRGSFQDGTLNESDPLTEYDLVAA